MMRLRFLGWNWNRMKTELLNFFRRVSSKRFWNIAIWQIAIQKQCPRIRLLLWARMPMVLPLIGPLTTLLSWVWWCIYRQIHVQIFSSRFTNVLDSRTIRKRSHGDAILCICRYLQGTKDKGLWFKPMSELKLACYCDADFAGLYNVENTMIRSVSSLALVSVLLLVIVHFYGSLSCRLKSLCLRPKRNTSLCHRQSENFFLCANYFKKLVLH